MNSADQPANSQPRHQARWTGATLAGASAIALSLALAVPAAAQDAAQESAEPDSTAQTPVVGNVPSQAGRIFTPADFARFAPRTALDMVRQIPGFSIQGGNNGNRGLGQATQNVLLNGQRVSGKSNDAATALSRIDAASVTRIEIVDGASLDIPGLSGQVANVIYASKAFGGTFEWTPQIRPGLDDNWFAGSVSLSGKTGSTDWNASLSNDAERQGHWGPEHLRDANGVLLLTRDEHASYYRDRPRLALSLARTAANGNILNVNAAGELSYFTQRVEGDVVSTSGARADELFLSTEKEWNAELGGDYEFALGGGRLKLVGLKRFEHSPFVNAFTAQDRAPGSVVTGNRFDQTVDEGETIGRGEYRWKAGVVDWQVSLEGAYNTLDSAAALFVRDAGGNLTEVPLPGANARVTEKRAESILTYGRPLATNLTLQANLGAEYSTITVSGPGGKSRSFLRPKGSVALAWTVDPTLTVNAKIERRVDQLSFYDFLASVDVANNTGRSNNPELVPPQRWRFEIDATKKLGNWGSIKPFARVALVQDVVDSIPVSPTEEALGNLADPAVIWLAGMEGTLLLDPLGWTGAKIDFDGQYVDARVKDPLTGARRRVSGEGIYSLSANLRHDIPGSTWAWGGSVEAYDQAANVRLDQTRRSFSTKPQTTLFVENKNVFGLTVRATVINLLDSRDGFERTAYVGRRTGPIAFTEDHVRGYGRIWAFSVSGKI